MAFEDRRVAYCPTMAPFIRKIDFKENVKFYDAGSAANALHYLHSGEVDAVLIGRTAKKKELNSQAQEKRLQQGYTLVFHRKMGIDYSRLSQFTIHTYLQQSIAEKVLPDNEIVCHDSLDDCLKDGLVEPVLIDWRDYRDEFELLIPMENGRKVPVFRAPVLYFNSPLEEILRN